VYANWLWSSLVFSTKFWDYSVALVRERIIPTERSPLVGEVSANFCGGRLCCVVSATDPLHSILGFTDRSRYFFFQVAPQLYSRG
jgi:hypothetical protein